MRYEQGILLFLFMGDEYDFDCKIQPAMSGENQE
jgi:hypothetical protein